MNILIACEYSGTVRDAFARQGHNAVSCDLLPSDTDGHHVIGDIRDLLNGEWDMLRAFPPCTHLAVSGARWFPEKRADGRQQEGIDFFMDMVNAPIDRIAIENPDHSTVDVRSSGTEIDLPMAEKPAHVRIHG